MNRIALGLFLSITLPAVAEPEAPQRVTGPTRKDEATLQALEQPGRILFEDHFDSEASFEHYFEIRGRDDKRALIVMDPKLAHRGAGTLQLTTPDRGGESAGAGVSLWLGNEGHDRVHLRYYLRWADDYDQGNLNHTGGGLAGVAGNNKWRGMGTAGKRPNGDDHFSSRFEGWRDWKRVPAPGYMFCYVYWMEMARDRDGNYWGNMLGPAEEERFVPKRGQWTCFEQMVKANTPGKADGELAAWIDGKLYLHYRGIRWRSTEALKVKRAILDLYIHASTQQNRVWFDDLAVSTGYIGPVGE